MIIEIGNEFYQVRYVDSGFPHKEDKGLLRCHKVARSTITGDWFPCDDDDYLINAETRQVVAREVGWDLRRIVIRTS